jgi:hypothetical protein
MNKHEYLNTLAIGLFVNNNMNILEDNNKEGSTPILFKDFVKQHLARENELENEIKQLKTKIKTTTTPAYARLYELFERMHDYISLDLREGEYVLNVSGFHLSPDEAEFIERQIKNADLNKFNKLDEIHEFLDSTKSEVWKGKLIDSTGKGSGNAFNSIYAKELKWTDWFY